MQYLKKKPNNTYNHVVEAIHSWWLLDILHSKCAGIFSFVIIPFNLKSYDLLFMIYFYFYSKEHFKLAFNKPKNFTIDMHSTAMNAYNDWY